MAEGLLLIALALGAAVIAGCVAPAVDAGVDAASEDAGAVPTGVTLLESEFRMAGAPASVAFDFTVPEGVVDVTVLADWVGSVQGFRVTGMGPCERSSAGGVNVAVQVPPGGSHEARCPTDVGEQRMVLYIDAGAATGAVTVTARVLAPP